MKVSPEARRLAKYKEKKKEISVATLQFDVTFCTSILCAPSWRFADWWPNMECWLGSFVILRGTGLVCLETLFLVIFQGGSGLPAPPPLESAHELSPFHGFAWKLTTSRYKIVRLHRHKKRDLLFSSSDASFLFVCSIWFFMSTQQSFSYAGRVFLGWTSTKLGQMCLAQGPQRSDAGEAWTRGPSVSSQALYHWATPLPLGR